MSNKNDPEAAVGMFVFAAVMFAALFLFFIAALVSLVLTVVCIFAWNKERNFFGQTITPDEARAFIGWGIVGGIAFGLFGEVMHTNGALLEKNIGAMPFIGYVVGSICGGGAYAKHKDEQERQAAEIASRPKEIVTIPPIRRPREEPVDAYEFASWDDEERRS